MTIAVQCQSCHKRLVAKEKLAGHKVKCPQCGTVLTIPNPQPEPEPVAQLTDLLAECETAVPLAKETAPSVAATATGASTPSSIQGTCASCGASMNPGATICLECGYDSRTGKRRELAGPKEKEKSGPPWVPIVAIGGSCVFVLGVVFAAYLMFLPPAAVRVGSSGTSQTPKEFVQIEFGEKDYLCEHPNGWQVATGGDKDVPPWAKFEKGGALIQIRDSLAGDAALQRSLKMGTAVERGEAPVDEVHGHRRQSVASMMRKYDETAAQKLDHTMGNALISEFTARPIFGKRLHGYRATVLHGYHQFTIVCRCPESEWQTLQPAFDHVISTLEPVVKEDFLQMQLP